MSSQSLYYNWRPVTREEMMGFLAVILNMEMMQLVHMQDYWSTNGTTKRPLLKSLFTSARFFQIFGMLYVGDPESTRMNGKIQPLLDQLSASFEAVHTPGREVAIGESVVSFSHQLSSCRHSKSKPLPCGIKAFVLFDSKTGYLQRVCVCYGRETQLVDWQDLKLSTRVVLTLLQPFQNKGYDLYVNRLYCSPLLATELSKVGITVTGVVQPNRYGIPKEARRCCKQPIGTVSAFWSDDGRGDILVLTWAAKRKRIMLSTKHSASMVEVQKRYILLYIWVKFMHWLHVHPSQWHRHTIIYCVIVINWVPRNYGNKRTNPKGEARGRGLFMLPCAEC